MKKTSILLMVISLMIIISGCSSSQNAQNAIIDQKAIMFKSESCGCCGVYASYIDRKGFDLEVELIGDMSLIKDQFKIPPAMESCHTTQIGEYFVEGHVPVEAIQKMMSEKPDIAGIAMPGMPSGSPGMPGAKYEPFVIYAVNKDGSISEFMRI